MPEYKTPEYIKFVHHGFSESGKTQKWYIYNVSSLAYLGFISWFAPWRKYCFTAGSTTIWDVKCLQEIIDFIDLQMRVKGSYVKE